MVMTHLEGAVWDLSFFFFFFFQLAGCSYCWEDGVEEVVWLRSAISFIFELEYW